MRALINASLSAPVSPLVPKLSHEHADRQHRGDIRGYLIKGRWRIDTPLPRPPVSPKRTNERSCAYRTPQPRVTCEPCGPKQTLVDQARATISDLKSRQALACETHNLNPKMLGVGVRHWLGKTTTYYYFTDAPTCRSAHKIRGAL